MENSNCLDMDGTWRRCRLVVVQGRLRVLRTMIVSLARCVELV